MGHRGVEGHKEERARQAEEGRRRQAEEEAKLGRAEEQASKIEEERSRRVEKEAQATKKEESESHMPLFQEPVFLQEERAREKPQLPIGERAISRRAVLVGLAGIAVAGGGLTWLVASCAPHGRG